MQISEQYNSVRVVDQPTALMLLNLSLSTWERLRETRRDAAELRKSRIAASVTAFPIWKSGSTRAASPPPKTKPPPGERGLLFPKGG